MTGHLWNSLILLRASSNVTIITIIVKFDLCYSMGRLCCAGVKLRRTWNKTELLALTYEGRNWKEWNWIKQQPHSVVLKLARLPDFSVTGKRSPHLLSRLSLSLLIHLPLSFHLKFAASPAYFLHTTPYLFSISIGLPSPLLCHEWKGAHMLVEALGSELSIKINHNYTIVKTRPSHWWPRNTSKWHGN